MCLYENDPNEIHMLIGADFAGRLLTGEIKQITENLVAIHTRLGWTLMGESGENTRRCETLLSLHVSDLDISELWRLDTIGIKDLGENQSKRELEEAAKLHFLENVKRDHEGRYMVNLPWIKDQPPLTSCRKIAEKRLANCVKSLEKVGKLSDYEEVFNEWENEDIIEKVESHQEIDEEHYLPHRPVFKENSTTKVRPVFDGSAKEKNSPSINDCLEKGPNLIELIPSLINRFRFGKFGVIADIKKAFLQIGSHNRISLKECPDHYKETAHTLLESFYVDNLVCSVNSKEKLDKLIVESQEILEEGKFELRGWEHNNIDPQTENTVPTERRSVPVLGLKMGLRSRFTFCRHKSSRT
ncbi:integrase catalytic domain-containing protein [Trichonephila clavipes]|nr:integrase catalytic domain-containing protein [Trichonephila clavipes]